MLTNDMRREKTTEKLAVRLAVFSKIIHYSPYVELSFPVRRDAVVIPTYGSLSGIVSGEGEGDIAAVGVQQVTEIADAAFDIIFGMKRIPNLQ